MTPPRTARQLNTPQTGETWSTVKAGAEPKMIPLSRGYFALVDASDYESLASVKWTASTGRKTHYARRVVQKHLAGRVIYMHRVILGAEPGQFVDHIDGNGLNNQRSNLRICNRQQNMANRGKPNVTNPTSPYKGTHRPANPKSKTNPWRARISVNGHTFHLGSFPTAADAHKAYALAAKKYFGEYAKL